MRIRASWRSRAVFVGALVGLSVAAMPAKSQVQDQHVVTLDELRKDAAQPAEVRRANEAAVKDFLSSPQAQKALNSANVDLKQVNKAVAQLSDADLARLAQQSRQAQRDFAAGTLSNRDLLWIILIIAGILLLALALR